MGGEDAGVYGSIANCLNRTDGVLGPAISLAIRNLTGSWLPIFYLGIVGLCMKLVRLMYCSYLVGVSAISSHNHATNQGLAIFLTMLCLHAQVLYYNSVSVKPARILYAEMMARQGKFLGEVAETSNTTGSSSTDS